MPSHPASPVLPATALAVAAALAWDASGLDIAFASLAGGSQGFALRHAWFLQQVLHDGVRWLAWLGVLALSLWACVPQGPGPRVSRGRRTQWACSALAAAGVVTLLKAASTSSCPWDLQEFGGLARYMSHWSGVGDGGPGHCFPAGHASSGFAFAGGFFALRPTHPAAAMGVLAASVSAGLVLGLAQQWRGAHFMSHTLWSGVACWLTALMLDRTIRWERVA